MPGSPTAARVRALTWVAFLGLAGTGAAAGAAKPARQPNVRVVVELFQVALLDGEKVQFLRRQAPLDVRGPDVAVAALQTGAGGAGFLDGPPAIVHSTSWRFESDGRVVLTYLAFGERSSRRAATLDEVTTLPWAELPGLGPTDPDRPRPAVLHHEDVLAHGLRHLALLARRKGNAAFADRLTERARAFFATIEPEIAGQIGGGPGAPSGER
jgi:hypothetical protein